MKIIISHDVDHLHRSDHYKDLIYPKLWIRETLELINGNIDARQWIKRLLSIFKKNRNNIENLIEFDKKYGVKASYYFGMDSGLGMNYKLSEAEPYIRLVEREGFEAGIHGIDYTSITGMKKERKKFYDLSGYNAKGIRMHYVRYDNDTFHKLAECGYLYDTTEFDKSKGSSIKAPYKINNMWEFPLCVMDGYLPKKIEDKKRRTLQLLDEAKNKNIPYFTMLFHDCLYCDAFKNDKEWYIWMIKYFVNEGYEFVSYLDAVKELENGGNINE